MNLPNKLTMMRMVLIPFFVFFMLMDMGYSRIFRLIALLIFIVASLTDMADGKIARKRNLITNFGKFMDPLADKLLVCSALICLMARGMIPAWMVIVIIAREFIVSGFRLIAVEQGKVIAAGMLGKVKTVFQMAAVILLILSMVWRLYILGIYPFHLLGVIALWGAVILTIASLIEYIIENSDVLKENDGL
ncbi:MAG: CDP-diacylglycerol--glycerol-3-phosphate 3-phosphatidyltransferase [Clostridiales bacterium]|nr:CDP-diacylglycerol--glycerol-3-phosphate 3-phosphatidyltransferase [Clostridiales bacterium]